MAIGVLKVAARFSEPVQIRRLHNLVAFASDGVWAVFVTHQKEDVRFLRHFVSLRVLRCVSFSLHDFSGIRKENFQNFRERLILRILHILHILSMDRRGLLSRQYEIARFHGILMDRLGRTGTYTHTESRKHGIGNINGILKNCPPGGT